MIGSIVERIGMRWHYLHFYIYILVFVRLIKLWQLDVMETKDEVK